MRSIPGLAWWGLVAELSAMACFVLVFTWLGDIEHLGYAGPGSSFIDLGDARLVWRWAMAGIALCIIGTTLLLVASRRPSQAST